MKYQTLILAAALALLGTPSFAQHGHAGPGGPPPGRGANAGGMHEGGRPASNEISNGSPKDVLSHNAALGGKIQSLTGQNAQTACGGFKNIGQCVAAAHVAKNLNIPGGFEAVKAKITGSGAVSLGKAIKELAPDADAKAESRKAEKQASEDLNEASS